MHCSLDNVLLTQGGTQGIDLVAALFLDRGDTILCENPTYMGAMGPFDVRDVNYVSIDIDDEGMNIELLEKALKEHPEAKLIYVIPDFKIPPVYRCRWSAAAALWSLPMSMMSWCLRTIPTVSFALTIRRCPPSRALIRRDA